MVDRRISAFLSPNQEINDNRATALELMERYGKDPHVATKGDIDWFWQDLDMECEKELVWEFVEPRLKELSDMYPFLISEWFMEFYRYMPDCLEMKLDKTGQIDWNLFFSLAYPLPKGLWAPFHLMIEKVNVAQNRIVKDQIVDEVWSDKEMRKSIFAWGTIPTIYTYYIPYQTLRKRVIEKDKKYQLDHRKQLIKEDNETRNRRHRELNALFRRVIQLQEEGQTVVFVKSNGHTT